MSKSNDLFRIGNVQRKRVANKVSVTVPASVILNLDSFQQVQKDILGRLGCPACTSGHDIRWDIISNYAYNENLEPENFG